MLGGEATTDARLDPILKMFQQVALWQGGCNLLAEYGAFERVFTVLPILAHDESKSVAATMFAFAETFMRKQEPSISARQAVSKNCLAFLREVERYCVDSTDY